MFLLGCFYAGLLMVKVVLEDRQQLPHTYLEITMHMMIMKMTMSQLGCDTE